MITAAERKLFGTDGIRGIAGEVPLDATTVFATGLALGHSLRETAAEPRVILGRDTRESSPWIAATLAAGLREAGARVESAGVMHDAGCCLPDAYAWIPCGRGDFRLAQSVARQRHQAVRRRWIQAARCGGTGDRRRDPSSRGAGGGARSGSSAAGGGQRRIAGRLHSVPD